MTRYTNNQRIQAQVESVYGTDPGSWAGTHSIPIVGRARTRQIMDRVDRNLVRGHFGGFEQMLATRIMSLGMDVEWTGAGTVDGVPPWVTLLRACGFANTVFATSRCEQTLLSTGQASATLRAERDGFLQTTTGVRGDLVIRIPAFGIPMLGFEFMGLDTTDSVSSAPAGVFTAWQRPRVVNETNASVWRIGSTYSAGTVSGGTQLVNGDFEIRIGNDVQHQKLLNGRMIEIVQRRVTGTGTLFFSASAENSHLAFAYADTLVGLGFTHGNAVGQTVGLHCGGVQILNLEPAEYQGREVLAATFQITPTSGNDELRLFSR